MARTETHDTRCEALDLADRLRPIRADLEEMAHKLHRMSDSDTVTRAVIALASASAVLRAVGEGCEREEVQP